MNSAWRSTAGGALVLVMTLVYIYASPDMRAEALQIIDRCVDEPDAAVCYEREVPLLYPAYSVPRLFDIVRTIRAEDPEYQFCHVLAHKIGERVVDENPNAWIEGISLNPPDGLCSNGYIHGVVGGRFRAEVLDDATREKLVPDFSRACEPRANWAPSDLDRAICYHGLGHLYDFITDADLPAALDMCNRTTPDDMHRVCHEGVFMQIYQPLEPDDFLMIERMSLKPGTTTVRAFCARFTKDEYEGACLRESWPYFRSEILAGAAGAFCSDQPNAREEDACYESASAIVGRTSLDDPAKAAKACNGFPGDRRITCFAASAQAVLEEDRSRASEALALCARASDMVDGCMAKLSQRAEFIFGSGSKERGVFCGLLPSALQTQCRDSNK